MRGCDLARHYKNRTNFQHLSELKKMTSNAAEEKAKTMDSHTVYMFRNGHSERWWETGRKGGSVWGAPGISRTSL